MTWALAAASLLATWLNIRRDRRCFAIWACTNTAWVAVDVAHGLPAQAALQGVYACLALYGLLEWRKARPA